MSSLSWVHRGRPFVRGGSLEAEVEIKELGELPEVMREVWPAVDEIFGTAAPDETDKRLLIEIWPDTGRIILIARIDGKRREVGSIVLNVPKLEEGYAGFGDNMRTFDKKFAELIKKVVGLLRKGLTSKDCGAVSQIVARSTDDQDSEVSIRE